MLTMKRQDTKDNCLLIRENLLHRYGRVGQVKGIQNKFIFPLSTSDDQVCLLWQLAVNDIRVLFIYSRHTQSIGPFCPRKKKKLKHIKIYR